MGPPYVKNYVKEAFPEVSVSTRRSVIVGHTFEMSFTTTRSPREVCQRHSRSSFVSHMCVCSINLFQHHIAIYCGLSAVNTTRGHADRRDECRDYQESSVIDDESKTLL